MKALYFERTGSLDQLKLRELPTPVPGPGEALVRIEAAAINPSDPKSVLGKMSETRPPRVPGRDFAGVVVEGPSEWKGKEVFGTGGNLGFGRDGTHAEFAAVPIDALVEKPEDLSFREAAGLGLAYLTAWSGIVDAGQISAKDTVLILGAAGAVGSSAVKIARHFGAKRIIGTLRDEAERARALGVPAQEWLVLGPGSDLGAAVRKLTDGAGADLALNVVGGALFEPVDRALALGGRHVVIASNPAEVTFNLVDFYHREGRLFGVDTLKLSFQQSAEVLRKILPLIKQRVLSAPETEAVPLGEAIAAYEAVLKGTASRKLVLTPA